MAVRRDLEIGEGLTLPLQWMTMATAVFGNRGTGKSTFGRVIAEEVVNHGQRFCALDIAGAFWGLKSSASGTDTGLPIVIFGGEHADVPLEPGAGVQVADIVASISQSIILDFELMSKGKQIAFLGSFLERLYHINRDPLLLLMDEAQRYAPQKPMSVEANKTLGATEDIVKLGRKHGLGPVVFTQRGAGLNKEVSELADVLVAFRSPGVLDQKRIREWLEANATAEQQKEVMAKISSLPTGTAIVASNHPDLPLFGTFAIRRPRTFDSSATPKPGERRVEPKVLAETDIAALNVQMAEAVERAKAEDPKELRKEIADLKRELASRPPHTVEVEVERVVEKPVPYLSPEVERSITTLIEHLEGALNLDTLRAVGPGLVDARVEAKPWAARLAVPPPPPPVVHPAAPPRPPVDREVSGDIPINRAEQNFLTVLAQFPDGVSRPKLAILAGYKVKSGHISNTLSLLRTKGLIERGEPIRATEAGLSLVGDVEQLPPAGPELIAHWMQKLNPAEQAFLRAIVEVYPDPISGTEIAERTGYKAASGHVSNTLSLLRTKGLVEGPTGAVRASEALVG